MNRLWGVMFTLEDRQIDPGHRQCDHRMAQSPCGCRGLARAMTLEQPFTSLAETPLVASRSCPQMSPDVVTEVSMIKSSSPFLLFAGDQK